MSRRKNHLEVELEKTRAEIAVLKQVEARLLQAFQASEAQRARRKPKPKLMKKLMESVAEKVEA